MEIALYNSLVRFKKSGELPSQFPSNKSNFLALAKKFEINSKDVLMRNSKIVPKSDELDGDFCPFMFQIILRNLECTARSQRNECFLGEN